MAFFKYEVAVLGSNPKQARGTWRGWGSRQTGSEIASRARWYAVYGGSTAVYIVNL